MFLIWIDDVDIVKRHISKRGIITKVSYAYGNEVRDFQLKTNKETVSVSRRPRFSLNSSPLHFLYAIQSWCQIIIQPKMSQIKYLLWLKNIKKVHCDIISLSKAFTKIQLFAYFASLCKQIKYVENRIKFSFVG